MNETCIFCGLPVSDNPDYNNTCDGDGYEAPDPYQCEINDNYEDVYTCYTDRARSADDI